MVTEQDKLLPTQKGQTGGKPPPGPKQDRTFFHFPNLPMAPPLQDAHNEGAEKESSMGPFNTAVH